MHVHAFHSTNPVMDTIFTVKLKHMRLQPSLRGVLLMSEAQVHIWIGCP